MKPIALCVGHSRHIKGRYDGGAVSVGNIQERDFNLKLAPMIAEFLRSWGRNVEIITDYQGEGYGSAMRWLAARIRALDACLAVELHFNSADASANGHEWLYWHTSEKGKELARACDAEMRKHLPQIKPRGAKPRFEGDRGAEFLRGTHCPAMIAEPFFGSNQNDWNQATEKSGIIADCIARGILTMF